MRSARIRALGALLGLLLGVLAPGALAADEEPPPIAVPEVPIEPLPPIHVIAPRLDAGPGSLLPAESETVLRRRLRLLELPAAVSSIDGSELTQRRLVRSMPDALLRLPGVLVQKTAPLQSSPFLRGFTGYQNLLLVDGVRLNNSAFRAGPNQYWSTVDPWTIERLEVVRGPHSVLYGSDAVGGTVNVIPRRRTSFCPGLHVGGRLITRGALGERMGGGRIELQGNHGNLGWLGGVSARHFGDIQGGAGRLPETGGIRDVDGDLRLDRHLGRNWLLTFAVQHVDQEDAPRTEQTIHARPFRGTVRGSELRRDLDQERTLVYARLAFDAHGMPGPVDRAHATLSWHRHEEEQDRLRTGDRRDLSGFTLDQFGAAFQVDTRTHVGQVTYGLEYYHDEVDSFRRDFVAGVPGTPNIQGPLGDDGRYDLLGIYVQDHVDLGAWDFFLGARLNHASARADRVDDIAVAGSDPATPGNVIRVAGDWTRIVGSLRATYAANRCWTLYGGVSQAFRAPSLSDLTSLESTSVVETPSPGLGPEDYVTFETGVKTEQARFTGDAAVWYTILENAIIRSPTGVLIGGTPEVRKDNTGDGWAWGIELQGAFRLHPAWTCLGNLGWMDSRARELDPATGALVHSPLSREQPLSTLLGLRCEPPWARWWAQAEWAFSDKANDLSLRDKADTRRIPPGGTPAWNVVHLRAGMQVSRRASVSLAVENVFDEDFRIHGSGVNEAGRNVVGSFTIDW